MAFLTHEPFYPPSGGGSSEAVYLVQEFVRRGHQVHVFGPRLDDPQAVAARFGIQIHEFKAWRMGRYTALRNFKYLLYPFFLERLVQARARSVPFDLVLSQHAIAAVTAGRLKSSLALPVAMNFLDYLTGFLETWPRYLAPRPFITALKRYELSLPSRHHADAVLTVSDTLADYFAQAGFPRARILPIYFGFDAELFLADPEAAPRPGSGPPTIVMHGSLDHHHLGRIALEASALVAQARPEATLKFVGQHTPALNRFLARLRARAPGLRVQCTGFVPYAEVARHLRDATVGIVPYEESTGVHCAFVAKVVEYLGVGLPVVSTPLQAIRRYFAEEPRVRFASFDGPSFAREILRWLEEPWDRQRPLAQAASQRVRRDLNWRVISRKAVDFVEQIRQPEGRP
ncbi:MAG: glycosyltransferase family 4 protein [Verrucomicrobia bacterium]|nr:glycosyltransferase family 4 protein [Verrucomicrobiota bacterium]